MSRLAVKRQIARVWRTIKPASRNGTAQSAIVVLYHAIGKSPNSVTRESFREQMAWLAANTQVVNVDTIASGEWPDSKSGITSAITFDDGYVGVHEIAAPILSEFNCPATVYVSTDTIDMHENRLSSQYAGLYENESLLNWMQLRELSKGGFSIGSHLMSHENLTLLQKADASVQLHNSKSKIEDIIGVPCTSFAYPWGKYSDSAVAAVRDVGYRSAVIALHYTIERHAIDPLKIPRADIQRSYTLDDFRSIVRGEWDFLGYYQHLSRKRKY